MSSVDGNIIRNYMI
ncbi:hypothetical protein CN271_18410, partial [Bacillus cereus]